VDAEIRYGWGDWPGLDTVEMLREEIFPVCAPKLASNISTPEDLGRFDLLHVPGYIEDWDAWLALAGAGSTSRSWRSVPPWKGRV
jgi:LysR family glycine cleavage system transcriptional activator